MSEPTPAASRPGTSTTPSIGPPIPATSIIRNAPGSGDPSSVLMAAKLPAAPITVLACAGASFLTRCTARTPRPLPIAMQRRLRAEHDPEAEGGERGEDDAGQVDRPDRARLEALRRLVPGGARQVADGEADEHPGHDEQRRGHHIGAESKPSSPGSVAKT